MRWRHAQDSNLEGLLLSGFPTVIATTFGGAGTGTGVTDLAFDPALINGLKLDRQNLPLRHDSAFRHR